MFPLGKNTFEFILSVTLNMMNMVGDKKSANLFWLCFHLIISKNKNVFCDQGFNQGFVYFTFLNYIQINSKRQKWALVNLNGLSHVIYFTSTFQRVPHFSGNIMVQFKEQLVDEHLYLIWEFSSFHSSVHAFCMGFEIICGIFLKW